MEAKLADIRWRGAAQDKRNKKEEQWVQQMERQAMQDYMGKDVLGAAAASGGGDLSAKIFMEKKAERDAEKAAIEAAANAAKEAAQQGKSASLASIGPIAGPSAPVSSSSGGPLKPVDAPKSGTKWHKEKETNNKQWYEAKTEEGHTYFWHVESHESRWDPPPDGYFSIKEQEEVNAKHEDKERKKVETMYVSQAIHGSHREDAGLPTPTISTNGPQARANPYGEWKTVQPK